MLFVDHPEEFARILPGFLPRPVRPAALASGTSSADELVLALRDELYGTGTSASPVEGRPDCDTRDFWTHCFLVSRAPVSQYDVLRRVMADRGDLPGHVLCLALSGSGFHGQQGRGWVAEQGNLHLSLALRCDLPARECGLALTMLPSVAVVDAVSGLGPRPAGLGIKWVNDIQVGNRKIGGVLTAVRSQEGRIRSAVLGIGLNVGVEPMVTPTPFTPGVTCVREHFPWPSEGVTEVLRLLLSAVAKRFGELVRKGPDPLRKEYQASSLVLGQEVEIWPDGPAGDPASQPTRRGRVLAIGPDLDLTLSDGPEPVSTGRLALLP